MKTYFVYILKCSDKSYYTGITNNLQRRLAEHEAEKDPRSYTAARLPLELVYSVEFPSALKAIAFEKQVKGWSRKKKEALIAGNWDKIRELAVCRNETNYAFKDSRDRKGDT